MIQLRSQNYRLYGAQQIRPEQAKEFHKILQRAITYERTLNKVGLQSQ